MISSPNPASLNPRPLRVRRWRTILAGGVLAGVGFVAAQAGSIGFLQVEFDKLAKAVDEKPIVVRASNLGPHRSYSTRSGGQQQGTSFGAARSSGSTSAPGAGLTFEASDTQVTGGATVEAGLFDLSPAAMPMRLAAASQAPTQFGGRFHGLIDGARSGSDRPSYGSSGRRAAQEDLADCCSDPKTQQGDALLTAPALDEAIATGGPVPEPLAWTMMILGLGLSGLMLRGERRRFA